MENYKLQSEDFLTQIILQKEVRTWFDLIDYVKNIPYGRNLSRTDFSLVISEHKGTCSSKHGLLQKVAELHKKHEYELVIGIYKMNILNTPKIGNALSQSNLNYIPEAHCYIKHNNGVIDVTSTSSDFERIEKDILVEKIITPDQVGEFKIRYHQDFIKNWIVSNDMKMRFEEVWKIREQCILNLSN
ncbi:hypothetical protein [Aquimarina sp. 2201CG5-10]|uniref:hypothetical protein n=1 Tax=Aquimarina callyspongiae TaxID=3098150 RepID=UPI002AB5C8B0|nr:hypothetical protein [Aquimarina sp. 2201CG5-10]MDY8138446.1 hypothetical protein [Aquimarina sp. 2201CG5-10]